MRYLFVVVQILLFSIICDGSFAKEEGDEKTNVVLIIIDDLGEKELGCYGNSFNETPTIDSLAGSSFLFKNAYSASPVCSPSRASIMTGLHPVNHGIVDYLKPDDEIHLDTAMQTMGDFYSSEGYRTGFIGKWHLSGYKINGSGHQTYPDQYGFDEFRLVENQGIGQGSYFYPYHFNKSIKNVLGPNEFLVDRIHYEAKDFIEKNHDKPFFLMVNHYAVHSNLHGKPELVEYFRQKDECGKSNAYRQNPGNDPYAKWPKDYAASKNNPHLAAQLSSIDQGIKEIIELLREKNLLDNTVIIVTSDNGGDHGVTENFPYREGKGWLYEGGLRIPLIVHLPELNEKKEITDPVVSYDLLPTLMDLNKKAIPDALDGISFLDAMKQGADTQKDRELFWIYPREVPHKLRGPYSMSILKEGYKLVLFPEENQIELYNLESDIGEQFDLAGGLEFKADSLTRTLYDKLGGFRINTNVSQRVGTQ